MFESLLNAFRAPDIRRRILYVLGILIVFRLLAHVPVPGVDTAALEQFFQGNAIFGLLDLFSGGGLSNFSVVGLGVNPYINASIIMQLMTGVVPRLQALQPRGRVRAQQDQPVHPLPVGAAGGSSRRTASSRSSTARTS